MYNILSHNAHLLVLISQILPVVFYLVSTVDKVDFRFVINWTPNNWRPTEWQMQWQTILIWPSCFPRRVNPGIRDPHREPEVIPLLVGRRQYIGLMHIPKGTRETEPCGYKQRRLKVTVHSATSLVYHSTSVFIKPNYKLKCYHFSKYSGGPKSYSSVLVYNLHKSLCCNFMYEKLIVFVTWNESVKNN